MSDAAEPIRLPEVASWNATTKRLLDIVIGLALLILLSAVMLLTAIAIRLDSPGPVFYRQRRVGRGGELFDMWKFRSMHAGSDDRNHREAAAAWFSGVAAPAGYKSGYDPRVTRMGRTLRRTSLDELPQLFNVIRGDMSLVGPRPAIPYELAYYVPTYFERQKVKPGISGLWQISGRDKLAAPQMMALDLRYVREQSLLLDLKILVLTVPALLGHASKGV
jgi:lipopolysaccharide/colanic/teichoic acid biosynthesis glycosyltransferase